MQILGSGLNSWRTISAAALVLAVLAPEQRLAALPASAAHAIKPGATLTATSATKSASAIQGDPGLPVDEGTTQLPISGDTQLPATPDTPRPSIPKPPAHQP